MIFSQICRQARQEALAFWNEPESRLGEIWVMPVPFTFLIKGLDVMVYTSTTMLATTRQLEHYWRLRGKQLRLHIFLMQMDRSKLLQAEEVLARGSAEGDIGSAICDRSSPISGGRPIRT